MVPLAVAPATSRQLLIPFFGGSAVLAGVVVAAWRVTTDRAAPAWRRVALGVAALLLAGMHLALDPVFGVRGIRGMRDMSRRTMAGYRGSLRGIDLAGRDVVLVAAPDLTTALHAKYVLRALGRPLPRSWQVLAITYRRHTLARTAPDSIELESADGLLLFESALRFFRPHAPPFRAGDRVEDAAMTVEILRADGGVPRAIRVRFARSLDDPAYLFVVADRGGLRPLRLPVVGGATVTPFAWTPEGDPWPRGGAGPG
jgi:hypothetical protein